MTDTIAHIICGGAGKKKGERKITINDHDVLNAAIRLDHDVLATYPGVSHAKALKLGKKIQKDYDSWISDLKKMGVPTYVYEPHAENLEP